MDEAPKYAMRLVVRRTGLSPHVIRVWEKRDGAVSPQCTTTNRRLYSNADIERLRMLHRATLAGQSIGQIAGLAPEQFRALIALDEPHAAPVTAASEAPPIMTQALPYVEAALAAVERLHAAALETMLARAAVIFSPQTVVNEVIVPLLYDLGDLWHKGVLRVTHEHLASAVIRTTLGHLSRGFAPSATAPRLVVTTPAGQLHEIGALIIATVAASDGWQAVYLGPSLPAEEIAAAAHPTEPKAVALSIVYPADDPHLYDELKRLRRILPNTGAMLVGGRATKAYNDVLATIGAVKPSGIAEFRTTLASLRQPRLGRRSRR